MRLLNLFLILFIASIVSHGQSQFITRLDGSKISNAEIDKTVLRIMENANVQGLNLAILNDKKPVFVRSYGFRNKPQNLALGTSTIVYGASFSKAVLL